MKLINPLIILRILGTILLIETISFLPCLPVAFIYNESLLPFLWSSVATSFCYLVFRFLSRKANIEKYKQQGYLFDCNVSMALVLTVWISSLPY